MTKLRKLTALLLAGALTLLLLTACSGGGGSSGPVAQAEAEVMSAINNGRTVNGHTVALANDDGMRTVANARLDALDKELELKGRCFRIPVLQQGGCQVGRRQTERHPHSGR